jgi:hypothetical protein
VDVGGQSLRFPFGSSHPGSRRGYGVDSSFGSLDHDLILSTLAEHIHDGRFLGLVKKLLDAGYLEEWKLNKTLSGVPQGGLCKALHKEPYAKQVTMQRETRKPGMFGHVQLNSFA